MRTISPTLEIAQSANVQRPSVQLEFVKNYAGLPTWQVTEYVGSFSNEDKALHQQCLWTSDNQLLRVVNVGGVLKAKRSTLPNANAGTWTTLTSGIADAPIALARNGASLWLYFWNAGRTAIQQITSANSGATWSSVTTAYTLPAGLIGWCLSVVYGVHIRLAFSTQVSATAGTTNDADIRLAYWTGSAWAIQTTNKPTGFAACRGLSLYKTATQIRMFYAVDVNLNAASGSALQNLVKATLVNDSATPTFGSTDVVDEGSSDSMTTWHLTAMWFGGATWLMRMVNLTPNAPDQARLIIQRVNAEFERFYALSPPYPFGYPHELPYNGMVAACVGASGLIRCGARSYSLVHTDQTAYSLPICALTVRQSLLDESLVANVYADMGRPFQLRLRLGYNGELTPHSLWYIDNVQTDRRVSTIRCYGVWGMLERETLLTDRVFQNASDDPMSCGAVLVYLLSIFSINADDADYSPHFTTATNPLWTLQAGTSIASLIQEICQYCGVLPLFKLDANWNVIFSHRRLVDLDIEEVTLGDDDHLTIGYGEALTTVNADGRMYTERRVMERQGYERLAQFPNALTHQNAARDAVYRALVATTNVRLERRVNVALEVGDIATLDIYDGVFTIHTLTIDYDAKDNYTMTLELGDAGWASDYG